MGIKGIYGEIGAGERIALSKMAVEKYEKTGRPLRIAIDVAIWQFQIQAGRSGSGPAIRTLYYRLLRLIALTIHPLFVFDGPNKPPFKRKKRTGNNGDTVSNMLTKQLLQLFGFPYHYAPGEAEAECALLQQNGVVDAVLSEDIDTLMFGSEICLRNWSSEDSKGNKAPTHVSAYYKKDVSDKYGLDREGMILIALMSGGDYITEGIPGCGIKLACEAARAGFGKTLCQLARSDTAGYKLWRETLSQEINTNSGKLFKKKHTSLKIPENFPDIDVLGYYTHPVVSNAAKVLKLKEEIEWHGNVDVPGLRRFVAEAFEWKYRSGAIRFIRGIAPALLIHKLMLRGDTPDSDFSDVILTAMYETEIVRNICGRRKHFSSDGIDELRLIFHPLDVVGINLDMEQEEPKNDFGRNGLAPRNSEGIEEYLSNEDDNRPGVSTRKSSTLYDPTLPDKLWVPRTIARIGIPLMVEDYEDALQDPRKFLKAKSASKKAMANKNFPSEICAKNTKLSKLKDVPRASSKSKKLKSCSSTRPESSPCFDTESQDYLSSEPEIKNLANIPAKLAKSENPKTKSASLISKRSNTNTKSKVFEIEKTNQNSMKSSAFNRIDKFPNQTYGKKEKCIEAKKSPISIETNSSFPNKLSSADKIYKTKSSPVFQINGNCNSNKKSKTNGKNSYDYIYLSGLDNDSSILSHLEDKSHSSRSSSPELPDISTLSLQCRKKIAKILENPPSTQSPVKTSNISNSIRFSSSHINKIHDHLRNDSKSNPKVNHEQKTPGNAKNLLNMTALSSSSPLSDSNSLAQPHNISQHTTPPRKRTILLRKSLPGTWKVVDSDDHISNIKLHNYSDPNEKNIRRVCWRMSEIELLDMTDN